MILSVLKVLSLHIIALICEIERLIVKFVVEFRATLYVWFR